MVFSLGWNKEQGTLRKEHVHFIFVLNNKWDECYLVVESLLDGDRGEVFLWSGSVLVHGESSRVYVVQV